MQDDKSKLESSLLLHLCSGLAAGFAAVHSIVCIWIASCPASLIYSLTVLVFRLCRALLTATSSLPIFCWQSRPLGHTRTLSSATLVFRALGKQQQRDVFVSDHVLSRAVTTQSRSSPWSMASRPAMRLRRCLRASISRFVVYLASYGSELLCVCVCVCVLAGCDEHGQRRPDERHLLDGCGVLGMCRAPGTISTKMNCHHSHAHTKQIPWKDYSNDDIELSVRSGTRLPQLVCTTHIDWMVSTD
jgi:hypothetical protein